MIPHRIKDNDISYRNKDNGKSIAIIVATAGSQNHWLIEHKLSAHQKNADTTTKSWQEAMQLNRQVHCNGQQALGEDISKRH